MTLVDTGEDTMTGGRLKRVADYVRDEEAFCFTYGDGVGDVDIAASIAFHKRARQAGHGHRGAAAGPLRRAASSTATQVQRLHREAARRRRAGSTAASSCCRRAASTCIDGDATSWEGEPLVGLARDGELMAFAHTGFWQPMDTLRDKNLLEELWQSGKAPWKVW